MMLSVRKHDGYSAGVGVKPRGKQRKREKDGPEVGRVCTCNNTRRKVQDNRDRRRGNFIRYLDMRNRETRPTMSSSRGVNAYWIDSASLR